MDHELNADAIRRVAFVTRRFHELRGLLPAVFGAALILATIAEQAAGAPEGYQYWALQPLLFANVMYTFGFVALDRSYRQAFGHPVGTAWQRNAAGLFIFTVLIGGLIDSFLPRSVSLMACALTAYGAWIVVRDWPWRIHFVAAVASGMTAAAVSALAPSGQDPLRVYALVGVAMVVTGLCDHRLLAASMPGHVSRTADVGSRRGRYVNRTIIGILFAAAGTTLLVWDYRSAEVLVRLSMMALLFAIQVAVSIPVAVRGIREFSRDGRVTEPLGPNVNVRDYQVVLLIAAAFSGAMEAVFGIRGLLALTLAAAFVCTAFSTRPVRRHHLPIGLAFALSGLLGRDAEPFQAFGMLLIAAGLAVLLSCFARHPHETSDAHTI